MPSANVIYSDAGHSTIVLWGDDGAPTMVSESHRNYTRVHQALTNGENPFDYLNADPVSIVVNLSARVSVVDGALHFDGDPTYNGLASTIENYHRLGQDANNLVRFMERLSANPNAHSREQLWTWTQAQNLTIDAEGFIVGYKGVYARTDDQDYLSDDGTPLFPLDVYPFRSSSSGHGIVDGHEINGYLPMGVGVSVEMPRDEVDPSPSSACSTGLHVGTYDYAKGYSSSGALLEVRFDPADVVSVPSDCGGAKLRCCRYTGVAIHDEALGDDLSAHEPASTWDEDEALDEVMSEVPSGFRAALRRLVRRGGKA